MRRRIGGVTEIGPNATDAERIDLIVEEFDCEKVAAMMAAVGWKWQEQAVHHKSIAETAKRLLSDIIGKPGRCTGTGGLVATCFDDGLIQIEFSHSVTEERDDAAGPGTFYYI